MPVANALARLQSEVAAVGQLGEEITQISSESQARGSELATLKAEKAKLDEQVMAAGLAVQQAQSTHSKHEAKVKSLTEQSAKLEGQIQAKEKKMADSRARLQSLSGEVACLEDAAHRVAEAYNRADRNLLQVLAMVGASSLGEAENVHLLRMTMSEYCSFHHISY